MWMMREITHRSSTCHAPGWFFGKCGSIAHHASSDSQNNATSPKASYFSEDR
jgi:hypothetical protein